MPKQASFFQENFNLNFCPIPLLFITTPTAHETCFCWRNYLITQLFLNIFYHFHYILPLFIQTSIIKIIKEKWSKILAYVKI